MQNGLNFVWGM